MTDSAWVCGEILLSTAKASFALLLSCYLLSMLMSAHEMEQNMLHLTYRSLLHSSHRSVLAVSRSFATERISALVIMIKRTFRRTHANDDLIAGCARQALHSFFLLPQQHQHTHHSLLITSCKTVVHSSIEQWTDFAERKWRKRFWRIQIRVRVTRLGSFSSGRTRNLVEQYRRVFQGPL